MQKGYYLQQINQQLYVDEYMYVYFINVVNLLEINILLLLLQLKN